MLKSWKTFDDIKIQNVVNIATVRFFYQKVILIADADCRRHHLVPNGDIYAIKSAVFVNFIFVVAFTAH